MAAMFDRPMVTKTFLLLLVIFAGADWLVAGRLATEAQTYREMFDKADLVVIATALGTKDTTERSKLLDTVDVIGVETEFATRVTLKGPREVRKFLLHHYREPDEQFTQNGPHLVYYHLPPGRQPDFLMFLTKEKDGRYAPVTGQTDPASFSVLELKSGVMPEGSEK